MGRTYFDGNAVIDFSLFEPRASHGEHAVRQSASPGVLPRPKTGERKKTGTRKKTKSRSRKASFTDVVKNLVLLTKEKQERIKFVSVLALGILLFFVIIMNCAAASELTNRIEKQNKELLNLQQEYEAMLIEYETNMSDNAVEEYATEVLGMKRQESNQVQYVNMGATDAFEKAPHSGIMSIFESEGGKTAD